MYTARSCDVRQEPKNSVLDMGIGSLHTLAVLSSVMTPGGSPRDQWILVVRLGEVVLNLELDEGI